jgi:Fe-S cluster assembly protein SufD
MTTLPTRRDEAWRYSDIDAVAALWPAPPAEVITLESSEVREGYALLGEEQAA